MMMKPESKRPIAIEDLLRLKRAERPPAEFWTEFDRALRAKQLAALVEKRPWWQTLPRFSVAFRRYGIPIGTTAIFAVTFFSLRDNPNTPAAPRADSNPRQEIMAPVADTAVASEVRSERVAVEVERTEGPNNGEAARELHASRAGIALASEATVPGEISRMLAGASAEQPAPEELSPSARAIAANLAAVRGSEPVLARTLLSNANVEVRAAGPAVEPLQQIASPGDRRRTNLLTAMVSMASYETPARTTETASARLSPDELYDRIHRFGVAGPRGLGGSMKF